MKEKNQYNWSISHQEVIDCDTAKVWDIISKESNLELFHPFCNKNNMIQWYNNKSIDEIEYLNGLILRRTFCKWMDDIGFDLYINQTDKPYSYVSWRLKTKMDMCHADITIYPYIFNQGNKIYNYFPFFLYVKPQLVKYLRSVLGGLKWYAENNIPVKNNHFGIHQWFS